ncbi:hypothetical protein [Streptomyces sp. NPDC127103]|uniref:hypothetical protein n=1 Tax=Streptomyces sp. NPDC127103 TaxID=3347139 RepID=UPI0036565568
MTRTGAYTFTVRNTTAGERNTPGTMVIRHLGDVTVDLVGMTRAEIAEWEWATDALNTCGLDEETFRLTVNGWTVVHPEVGTVGMLFQGAGTYVHVEWYDATNDDFFSAGWVRTLRHGAAAIIGARQRATQSLPIDAEPEPVKTPEAVPLAWLENGTQVRYHGSLAQLSGGVFWVRECECFDCDGYQLRGHKPTGGWGAVAVHVGRHSVTPLEEAVDALDALAASHQ